MHHDRNGVPSPRLPDPASVEYHAERLILIELCVDPPPEGDELGAVADRLTLSPRETRAAVEVLEGVGLARRDGPTVRASGRAIYFDHLCPITF